MFTKSALNEGKNDEKNRAASDNLDKRQTKGFSSQLSSALLK